MDKKADTTFNSLFEMQDAAYLAYKPPYWATFNSLFEMLPSHRGMMHMMNTELLSILYLRCRPLCGAGRSVSCRCTFNSLFEMP